MGFFLKLFIPLAPLNCGEMSERKFSLYDIEQFIREAGAERVTEDAVQDLERDGRWSDISQTSFQRYELGQMRLAVRIGTAHGAHVDLATMPAAGSADDSVEASRSDLTARRLVYDRLIHQVAREYPRTVSVVDYGRILTPGGVFHEYLDGVQVRSADGVHTPVYAPGNAFVDNASEPVAHAPAITVCPAPSGFRTASCPNSLARSSIRGTLATAARAVSATSAAPARMRRASGCPGGCGWAAC